MEIYRWFYIRHKYDTNWRIFEGSYHGQGNWDIYDKHHPDQHDLLFLPSNPDVGFKATDEGFINRIIVRQHHMLEFINNGYQTQLYSCLLVRSQQSGYTRWIKTTETL